MTTSPAPFVLFVAAAGPRMGFGHLVRCGALADALGVRREMALRGSMAAVHAAVRSGWSVHRGPRLLAALRPDLLVIDVPTRTECLRWIRQARRAHVPVAAIVDGWRAAIPADLVIDGSFAARSDPRGNRLTGPAWAMLSRRIAIRRSQPRRRDRRRVLIALGGGAHIRRLGVAIARELVQHPDPRHRPDVDLAAGFVDAEPVPLPRGCRWIQAPTGLADALATAAVAVVGGGMTLYEACALATPVVAVPVVHAQRPAIVAAARARVIRRVDRVSPRRVAHEVHRLLGHPARTASQAAAAARVVDGRGADRVAARLHDLIGASCSRGARHAA